MNIFSITLSCLLSLFVSKSSFGSKKSLIIVNKLDGHAYSRRDLSSKWYPLKIGNSLKLSTLVKINENSSITFQQYINGKEKGFSGTIYGPTIGRISAFTMRSRNSESTIRLHPNMLKKKGNNNSNNKPKLFSLKEAWKRLYLDVSEALPEMLKNLKPGTPGKSPKNLREVKLIYPTKRMNFLTAENSLGTNIVWQGPQEDDSYKLFIWKKGDKKSTSPTTITKNTFYHYSNFNPGEYFYQIESIKTGEKSERSMLKILDKKSISERLKKFSDYPIIEFPEANAMIVTNSKDYQLDMRISSSSRLFSKDPIYLLNLVDNQNKTIIKKEIRSKEIVSVTLDKGEYRLVLKNKYNQRSAEIHFQIKYVDNNVDPIRDQFQSWVKAEHSGQFYLD